MAETHHWSVCSRNKLEAKNVKKLVFALAIHLAWWRLSIMPDVWPRRVLTFYGYKFVSYSNRPILSFSHDIKTFRHYTQTSFYTTKYFYSCAAVSILHQYVSIRRSTGLQWADEVEAAMHDPFPASVLHRRVVRASLAVDDPLTTRVYSSLTRYRQIEQRRMQPSL